jgi:hypothetical protein
VGVDPFRRVPAERLALQLLLAQLFLQPAPVGADLLEPAPLLREIRHHQHDDEPDEVEQEADEEPRDAAAALRRRDRRADAPEDQLDDEDYRHVASRSRPAPGARNRVRP